MTLPNPIDNRLAAVENRFSEQRHSIRAAREDIGALADRFDGAEREAANLALIVGHQMDMLDGLARTLDGHAATLGRIDATLDRHAQILDRHAQALDRLETGQAELKVGIDAILGLLRAK